VDDNEPSQAIERIEKDDILEMIDHDRLGIFRAGIATFINKPVGRFAPSLRAGTTNNAFQ
jgi:inorganic pyrophosphatase/exopolyphosphatase